MSAFKNELHPCDQPIRETHRAPESRRAIAVTDPDTGNHGLIILMPVYNDWGALSILLPSLERELNVGGLRAEVLMVDDGSTVPVPPDLGQNSLRPSKASI